MGHDSSSGNNKKKKRSSYEPLRTADDFNDDEEEDFSSNNKKDGIFMDVENDAGAKSSLSLGDDRYRNNKNNNMATIYRLLQLARPERRLMLLSAISMVIGSGVSLAVPYFSGRIIDLSLQQDRYENNNDDNNTNPGDVITTEDDDRSDDRSSSPFRLLLNLLVIMTLASVAGFFRLLWQAQAGHRLVARLK
jgi:hypothetical protein